jgi:hypothetical protein
MENGSSVPLAPFLRHFLEEAELVLGLNPVLDTSLYFSLVLYMTFVNCSVDHVNVYWSFGFILLVLMGGGACG